MKLSTSWPLITVVLTAAQVAHAGDASPKLLTFAKDTEVAASFTLLSADAKTGRSNPVFNNYRPQLRFSAGPAPVTCALLIPKPAEKVEPGETAPVSLKCIEDFKVVEGKLSFTAYEGGRKVGEGSLKP